MDNFIVAKTSSKGMKRMAFVDTANLDCYRRLGELTEYIYIDDVKSVMFRDMSAVPAFVFLSVYVNEEKFEEICKGINSYEKYLENEYNENTPSYVKDVTLDAYLELCDKYLS